MADDKVSLLKIKSDNDSKYEIIGYCNENILILDHSSCKISNIEIS